MNLKRQNLYRLPWSKTDNPNGWVEVTDECDLFCPGCYRYKLEGHRHLDEVKNDIIACQEITNCYRMGIAGGEPLIYPHLVEVVDFISQHKMRPVIFTNGEKLTWELAHDLKKAGLAKFFFHIDSGQERPGWTGKPEPELNKLRQHYADLIWELGGVQTGYNVTVFNSTLKYIPEIVNWCRMNIHKVQHLHLIAARGIPNDEGIEYMVNGQRIDLTILSNNLADTKESCLSTEDMCEIIVSHFPDSYPCAYLNGTTALETYKFLVLIYLGSKKQIFGGPGAKTAELVESISHFFKGRFGGGSNG
jgi:sulfatase maturation enzyme AslB (radical SAM superfamily)